MIFSFLKKGSYFYNSIGSFKLTDQALAASLLEAAMNTFPLEDDSETKTLSKFLLQITTRFILNYDSSFNITACSLYIKYNFLIF